MTNKESAFVSKCFKTRRLFSETKAIMSLPYVTGWRLLFSTRRCVHGLMLLQAMTNTPSAATWEMGLNYTMVKQYALHMD